MTEEIIEEEYVPSTKTVYGFHPETSFFTGSTEADESPLEPGVFLMPANTTDLAPPVVPEGQRAVFNGSSWSVQTVSADIDRNLNAAPSTLFGGPTMKEVFYGNK